MGRFGGRGALEGDVAHVRVVNVFVFKEFGDGEDLQARIREVVAELSLAGLLPSHLQVLDFVNRRPAELPLPGYVGAPQSVVDVAAVVRPDSVSELEARQINRVSER